MKHDENLKYLEEQIRITIRSIETIYFKDYLNEDNDKYNSDLYKNLVKEKVKKLYYFSVAYLELNGLSIFCNMFKDSFQYVMVDDDKIMDTFSIDPEFDDELEVIVRMKNFLDSINIFQKKVENKSEISKVVDILNETPFIISKSISKIENEKDIYDSVKWVLSLYYPDILNKNRARFISDYKTYSPDILIPSLKLAIEYKYIKDVSQNVEEFLNQLKTDSLCYIKDEHYTEFVAVIHISDASITSKRKLETAWKNKKFPPNWHLVVTINDKK